VCRVVDARHSHREKRVHALRIADLIVRRPASIQNAKSKVLDEGTEFMKLAALAQAHDLDAAPHGLRW
jgi:hypothetical protein